MIDYDHLYVEPHPDDVALSCGGLVASQAARGERVLVVTLFAGDPADHATAGAFARQQHARWDLGSRPMVGRRREQDCAMARLGAEWRSLGWLDAIYRGERYRSDPELFGALQPDELPLVAEVRRELASLSEQLPRARWYVPLAVGNHVDHQIARDAARGLADLIGYEDFPYAARTGAAEGTARAAGAVAATLVDVDLWIDRKIEAIACYRSQLSTLFGSTEAMPDAVRAYAADVGAGRLRERYWAFGGRSHPA